MSGRPRTPSRRNRDRNRARAWRLSQAFNNWLANDQQGTPPQPMEFFPELPRIIKQAGINPENPPPNWYMPRASLSNEENRYLARLARERARHRDNAHAAGKPYGVVKDKHLAGNEQELDERPVSERHPDEPTNNDPFVRYELAKIANAMRAKRGEPAKPLPPKPLTHSERWQAAFGQAKLGPLSKLRETYSRVKR